MFTIFQSEINDGLSDQLQDNAIALASTASFIDVEKNAKFVELITKGSANPNQLDLFYLESILASVGWNKNTDVFDALELVKAMFTPVDKPFNFMHNELDIIGHITSSRAIDATGQNIDINNLPDAFDVVVGSVLYRRWENTERQGRMDKIIAEIKDGKWCVSMECRFPHFDYAVITPDGQHKVIARNQDSAFLTKHLIHYGGTGEYQGHKLGRLLRSFYFSGKGLVDRPANPRSKILIYDDKAETSVFSSAASISVMELNKKMADTTYTKEQYDALKAELDAVKSKAEADSKKEVDSLKQTVASLKTELEAAKAASSAKDETLTKVQAELDSTKKSLSDLTLVATKARRIGLFANKDVEEAKAKDLVEKFATASDESFDAIVAAYPDKKKDEKDNKKDKMDDAKALDKAKADDTTKHGTDDVNQDKELVTKASAWFSSFLKNPTKESK